ncbi:MAG: biotin--[acetyl-CoA-carboxylase] ligase [Gammaproteobacteria bacterium]|nr:biotin--[acetyl-CoA-carboxylase] ligase [Gammaproteobacteria bacterium]
MTDRDSERALVTLLADGRPHGLQQTCERLASSWANIDALIGSLARKGLQIERQGRETIRLPWPIQLLDEDRIREALAEEVDASLWGLEVLWCTDSTNSRLMARAAPGGAFACFAEFQTAGRGRQARPWRAPLGGGLCMSVSYALPEQSRDLAAIGLVAGVAVRNALKKCGAADLQLKWPNDLMWQKRKVGGLLSELRSDARNDAGNKAQKFHRLVVGVGINYRLDAAARTEISRLGGLAPADIEEVCGGKLPDRNVLAAQIAGELLQSFKIFTEAGFEPFASAWRAVDACKDAPVVVTMQSRKLDGVARGIDASGALQLDVGGKITRIVSAEVSMRPA